LEAVKIVIEGSQFPYISDPFFRHVDRQATSTTTNFVGIIVRSLAIILRRGVFNFRKATIRTGNFHIGHSVGSIRLQTVSRDEVCHTLVRNFFIYRFEGKEDLGVDGRTTLRWILEK
jgi:hypothetical protein